MLLEFFGSAFDVKRTVSYFTYHRLKVSKSKSFVRLKKIQWECIFGARALQTFCHRTPDQTDETIEVPSILPRERNERRPPKATRRKQEIIETPSCGTFFATKPEKQRSDLLAIKTTESGDPFQEFPPFAYQTKNIRSTRQ